LIIGLGHVVVRLWLGGFRHFRFHDFLVIEDIVRHFGPTVLEVLVEVNILDGITNLAGQKCIKSKFILESFSFTLVP